MTFIRVIDYKTETNLSNDERTRIGQVVKRSQEATRSAVKYVIRSPGRINLIGDHIDYHGFSVLPMAIENSIIVCVSTTETLPATFVHEDGGSQGDSTPKRTSEKKHLVILNADQELYPTHDCEHSFSHGATLDQFHRWYHYVICGYHGVLTKELLLLEANQIYEHAKGLVRCDGSFKDGEKRNLANELDRNYLAKLDNIILFVDSNLPPASGLSSSSALVCASALATRLVLSEHKNENLGLDATINSESLAEDCAKFEHLVGTHGGGMDQAVILTAQEGYAKHVEFMPKFKCSNVHLPRGTVWLVSHCGESYPKAATSGFNSRVLETKLAAALILKKLKPSSEIPLDHTITLYKVKDELASHESLASDFMATVEKSVFLNELAELSFDEVGFHLDLSRTDLVSRFKTTEEFLEKSGLNSRLCLLKRCRHVLEESDRVRQFKLICETTRDPIRLGELMTDSHASLRDNYECSHPALDNLVEIALKAGALGARLTGAGWGGCIVSLVDTSKAERVIEELKKVSKFTFRTEPQSGASIIKMT